MTNSKSFDPRILIEIAIVLGVKEGVKWVANYFEILGAGSIGVWSGILIATLFMKKRKIRWRDLGLSLPKGKREWIFDGKLVLLAVVMTIVLPVLIMDFIIDPIFGLEETSFAADKFGFILGRPLVFISYLVGIGWFGAALGEELLYRGFYLNRLADFFGKSKLGWSVALIIQAIIFGLAHSYQGLSGILATSIIALSSGVIYLIAKRRLFPLIVAHAIIDTIGLTAFYINNGVIN